MENNKEIGKLFKEKIALLDVSPKENGWDAIRTELENKKKKRIFFWFLPFALCLVGISSILFLKENNLEIQKELILKANTTSVTKNNNDSISGKIKANANNSKLESTKKNKITIQDSIKKIKSKNSNNNFKYRNSYSKYKKLIKSTKEYDEYEVVQKYRYIIKKKNGTKFQSSNSINKKNKPVFAKILNRKKNNIFKSQIIVNKSEKKLVLEKIEALETADSLINLKNKNNVYSSTYQKKSDSILNLQKNNSKDKKKYKKNTNEKAKKDDDLFIFFLSPYVGINYYNVLGANNISLKYNDSSKTGNLTSTFGFYGRCMLNNKLGFRIGIGKSNVSYTTSIDKSNQILFDYTNVILNSFQNDNDLKIIFTNDSKIMLNQKVSYLEVPIELYYVWKDQKFGFATSGGIGILFQINNSLHLKSNTVTEFEIGKPKSSDNFGIATANLNTHFTYKFSDSINFEISPQFKFQLSGIENSQGIKPIIFSLQTGFSYKL